MRLGALVLSCRAQAKFVQNEVVEMGRRVAAADVPTVEITSLPTPRNGPLLDALGIVTEQWPLQHEATVRLLTNHAVPLSDVVATTQIHIEAGDNIAERLGGRSSALRRVDPPSCHERARVDGPAGCKKHDSWSVISCGGSRRR